MASAYFYYDCLNPNESLKHSGNWTEKSTDGGVVVLENSENGTEVNVTFGQESATVTGANKDQTNMLIKYFECAGQPAEVEIPFETVAAILSEGSAD